MGDVTGRPGDGDNERIGRRDALKKLGVGAAIVWTAPAAMSFFSKAAAGSPPPTTTPTTLPPEIPVCTGATCQTFVPCTSQNPDCVCIRTPEGGFCFPGSTSCGGLDACTPDNACPPGFLCAIDTCCGGPVCVPISLIQVCPPDDGPTVASLHGRRRRVSTGADTLGG